MNLTNLNERLVEWLKGGPESDVVVSSRVRLARNVEGWPFVNRADDAKRAELEAYLRDIMLSLDAGPPLHYVELDGLESLLVDLLLERRLISREHAEADWARGVAFDDEERLSVMVNEEDHLRIQYMLGGLRLEEAYRQADRFDDMLAEGIPFAYSPRFGYLTACPTNVGTGLRASVMLHLAGLAMSQTMDRAIALAREEGLALRGGYGEGAHGAGDFYQFSNQSTIGRPEEEIVESVRSAALRLTQMEREARQDLYQSNRDGFRQRIQRAFDMLRSAHTISSQETLSLLSQLRMALEMDVFGETPPAVLADLFLLTLPAHLQTMEGRELDSSVRNELRAVYVRDRLKSR
ncbi:MAG: ATP--guanido phosphotransferase [Candidatus Brocadiia bacterium]